MSTTTLDGLDRELVRITLERRGNHWTALATRSADGLDPVEPDGPEVRGTLTQVLHAITLRLNGRELERLDSGPIRDLARIVAVLEELEPDVVATELTVCRLAGLDTDGLGDNGAGRTRDALEHGLANGTLQQRLGRVGDTTIPVWSLLR